MIHPIHLNMWAGMAIELLTLATLMGGLALYQRWRPLPAELSRKLFHIGGGLSTLSFPWLFESAWPVILLALVTIPALLALKYMRAFKGNLGAVLYRVDRASLGELYFAFTHAQALLVLIPVLILTLADPAAAAIGCRYGHLRYTFVKGRKSVEGSVAFFLVAFACVLYPLLILAHMGLSEAALLATPVGLLATLAEAVAWEGLDNLFIPIFTGLLLAGLLQLNLSLLLLDLGLTLGLLCAIPWLAGQHGLRTFRKEEQQW
jgi:phytol kinase